MGQELKNEFSWSVSRDAALQECPRKYFFNYYGFWGGWQREAPKRTREVYVLKQLLARPTWIGQVVHSCIARTLQNLSRGVKILAVPEILSITRQGMRQDFRQSRAKHYWQNPKTHTGLFEHEYGIDVSDEEWKQTADTVDQCLNNFYESPTFGDLRKLKPEDFLEVERFSSFRFDDIEIRIKLDCATREHDRVVVWDWKTGKREDTGLSLQMACYAYYAKTTYRVDLTKVTARRFDLYRNKLYDDTISDRSLDEILAYIRGSIKDMEGLLKDPANNVPVEEERFRKVERPEFCLRCNYLKVCEPDI